MDIEYHRPCPTCSPNNDFGYVCPVPILDGTIPLGENVPAGHEMSLCGLIIPYRGIDEEKCGECSNFVCQNFGGPDHDCQNSTVETFQGIPIF